MNDDFIDLHRALQSSLKNLDDAYRLVRSIPLDPRSQNCVYIGEAVGLVIQVQKHLKDACPELAADIEGPGKA